MWVRMMIGISGGRADDRAWPAVGHEIDVPDHEGEDLIRARHAIYVGPSGPDPEPEPERPVVSESSPTSAGPVEEPAAPSGLPDTAEAVPEPKPSDTKQAWIDYAISCDPDNEVAIGNMNKADLMSNYGGRL